MEGNAPLRATKAPKTEAQNAAVAAQAMLARIPDNPFTTTIDNMGGRLPFWLTTLESQQLKLVPGLAEWSGVFQALHSDAFAYQGWTAIFPEVGPEATADFNIAR